MKKYLLLLLVVFLFGCSETNVENNKNGNDIANVFSKNVEFSYKEKYFQFKDLLEDPLADFYYGKVVRIESKNNFVDSVYFKVYKSNNETVEEIRISIEKNFELLKVDKEYILHLNYSEQADFFSLSDHLKSIFVIEGNEINYHPYFVDELEKDVNKDLDNFLKKIFV